MLARFARSGSQSHPLPSKKILDPPMPRFRSALWTSSFGPCLTDRAPVNVGLWAYTAAHNATGRQQIGDIAFSFFSVRVRQVRRVKWVDNVGRTQ